MITNNLCGGLCNQLFQISAGYSLARELNTDYAIDYTKFVPPGQGYSAKKYRNTIFTRILGNDNIFKGLSTFAVEMLEFKNILENCDAKSLVIGDELCSGTETESASSIILAGLKHLDGAGACYIFATHFHEIVNYEEITSKSRLKIKHMAMKYDLELDCLVFSFVI